MENRKQFLGINKKSVIIFHRIMLLAILHSSFVAPCQSMIQNAYGEHQTDYSNYYRSQSNNSIQEPNLHASVLNEKHFSEKKETKSEIQKTLNTTLEIFYIDSDIKEGTIGLSNAVPLDDPKDNLFKFFIKDLPIQSIKAYLTYDLFGVQDYNGVARSINNRPSTGGYVIKNQLGWSTQKEEININWLQNGENKIMFSTPQGAQYQYKVKNVKLEFNTKDANKMLSTLVVNNQNVNFIKGNQLYIKGFLRNFNEDVKVFIDEKPLNVIDGEYEGFLKLTDQIKEKKYVMLKAIDSNGLLGQELIALDNLIEADRIFTPEENFKPSAHFVKAKTSVVLKYEGAILKINDSALIEDKEISISRLRAIDIAPMSSGLVNVTKNGLAYRFLPDGTKFKKPVDLSIEYDEQLIPKGHNANEIKTFYFNTNTKSWTSIERDSINKNNKTIVSSTNHFTDYINGIIQSPESPETAGFTATMMNDIKAADPSAEMTLISPPAVSQKGDANISYPIKIPAGRKGIQPQLAVQYSSDGGNGLLGQGWNISTPAISIDTKWGVPTFDTTNESEIYLLNGEQLMYPKIKNFDKQKLDWMPNRQYEYSFTPLADGTIPLTTEPQLRTYELNSNIKLFTPRKQGSFTKIERLGTNTKTYYWKVTNTDGTISWYGGDELGLKENTIIRQTQNPNASNINAPALLDGANIVHWGLYKTQDVYGNNATYEYQNESPSDFSGYNENLNGGNIFRIKKIYYTGTNNTKGKYNVEFINETTPRTDISINARLGMKQIEPYRLNSIVIKNVENTIRSYDFSYKYGEFDKSLLDYISEKDSLGNEFYKHTFDYYNDVKDKEGAPVVLFNSPTTVTIPSTNPNFSLFFDNLIGSSKISSNESVEAGWELRPAAGVEFFWVSNKPNSFLTIGAPFGKSYTRSKGMISMTDIDGNGLEDIVFKSSDGLKYLPNEYNSEGVLGFGSIKSIEGIKNFSKNEGETETVPLEAIDLKLSSLYAGTKRFKSTSDSKIYFTDGNGDGLIDIVTDDKVFFNRIGTNGNPTFSTTSANTPNLLITANAKTTEPVIKEPFLDLEGYDVVKVWVAPRNGTISINDQISLNANSTSTTDYSIESFRQNLNNGIPFRLYTKTLNASLPTTTVNISNYGGNSPNLGCNCSLPLNVVKGQKFYFRLHHKSLQNDNQQLNSNPTITYTDISELKDENNISYLQNKYDNSFILSANQNIDFQKSGQVVVSWADVNVNHPSDDVNFYIVKETKKHGFLTNIVRDTIYRKFCPLGSNSIVKQDSIDNGPFANTFGIDLNEKSGRPDEVNLRFVVNADSNLKWKSLEWKPKVVFTANVPEPLDPNQPQQPETTRYAIAKYSIYKTNFLRKLYKNNTAPNSIVSYGIKPNINITLPTSQNNYARFLMVVKKDALVIGKRLVTIFNGEVTVDNNQPITIYTGNLNDSNYIPVSYSVGYYIQYKQNDDVFNRYLNAVNNVTANIVYLLPSLSNTFINYSNVTVNSQFNEFEHLGPLNKEWGQFIYNAALDLNPNIPSDTMGKLLNDVIINPPQSQSYSDITDNLSECEGIADEAEMQQCLALNLNTSMNIPGEDVVTSPGSIGGQVGIITNNPLYAYVPSAAFRSTIPYRNYKSTAENPDIVTEIEKWTGLFDSQYSSATDMKSGIFKGSSWDNIFPDDEGNPVTAADTKTGMFAITKSHKTSSRTFNLGWGLDLSVNNQGAYNVDTSDFMDLNGDRYPDLINSNKYQTTTMTGGHKLENTHQYSDLTTNDANNVSITTSGSAITGLRNTIKSVNAAITNYGLGTKGGDVGPPAVIQGLGVTAALSGDNEVNNHWIDLNGDGLPDKVSNDSGIYLFQYNIGNPSIFTPYYPFSSLTQPKTKPNPLGLSFSIPINFNTLFSNVPLPVDLGISVGMSSSGSGTSTTFQDINCDGLVDLLNVDGSSNGTINFNNGNGFDPNPETLRHTSDTIELNEDNTNTSVSISGSISYFHPLALLFGIPIPFFVIPILWLKAGATVSANANLSISNTQKTFKDFNGDGFVDYIERDGNDLKVYYSRIGRTNKLKKVTNPLNGSFVIDYKPQVVTFNNPHPKWAMSNLTIEDGYNKTNDGADTYQKEFAYENAKYDRRERDFYGYETVKTKDINLGESGNPEVYRTSVSKYHNQSYFLNGLLKESYTIKGEDDNQKFSKTINKYEIRKLDSINNNLMTNTILPDNFDVGGAEGRRSAAVVLKSTTNELYELAPTPLITSKVEMTYDDKGRVVEYVNKGNLATTSDDYKSVIKYHNLTALNILNVPASIKVFPTANSSGPAIRERRTEINPSNGSIIKVSANNNGDWLHTEMEYDAYGNMVYKRYPSNNPEQAMYYYYTYDTTYNKYITEIKDAHDYHSSATYNSNFDKVETTTDLTGNKMIYQYDTFGRNTFITAPKEILADKPYTLKFDYYPFFNLLPENSGVSYYPNDAYNSTFVPVAVTSHYDQQHPENDIETYTFIDGLARPIQIKKDIALNFGTPQQPNYLDALSISGITTYDDFGRAIQQFLPWSEIKDSLPSSFIFNQDNAVNFTSTQYDELDRPVLITDPDDHTTNIEYTLAASTNGAIAIKTKTDVDQNGEQHVITENYKDVAGRVIATNNVGGPNNAIWTKYFYNSIGELMQYTDDQNLSTTYEYDMLGRKIVIKHPDNGVTFFKYDNVNLVEVQTNNLLNQGTSIRYDYDINRIKSITFPPTPNGLPNIANVENKYGNTGNQTGRLIYQKDASGTHEFNYGNMGELTDDYRTVVGPNIPTRVFKTHFEYDSWNRLQNMIYPDGEKVNYNYDLGGNLTKMTGELANEPYSYIQQIDYDYFEQRTYLRYGNQTETFYNYSPTLRRLNNLNVKTADSHDLYNNQYKYDYVGNVTQVNNSAGITENNMAGTYSHDFGYDNLNRLNSAKGNFEGSMAQIDLGNDANSHYNLKMSYNTTHGIQQKAQNHDKNGNSFAENTFSNKYEYNKGTHQVAAINDGLTNDFTHFKYDANGNIILKKTNNTVRDLRWDESNRLRVVSEEHALQHYIYDANGERVLKANSDHEETYQNGTLLNAPGTVSINGYTSYPSAFIVITSDGVYSKHYYAGTQRIVSRLGEQDAKIFNVENCRICQQQNNNGFDPNQLQQAQKADLQTNADELKKGTIRYKEYKAIPLAEQENAMAEQNTDSANSALAPPSGVGGLYFYHPDHLGTSTALTDYFGKAYQFFLNLPFGETMAQQLGSNYYNSPYKFNGKELDEETGLYYYGARYYSPRESIWLSVDPLAEKYPNVSPYVYCLNNPTVLIDPDGMAPEPPKLNGIKNIQNVLAGRNWVDYRSKITRTSSLFGYELSRTSARGQCADYSRLQVEQGEGNHTAVGSKNRIDMYVEKGGDKAKFDLQKGINTIIENLGEGKSVMAGVMYDSHETGNPNGATNHYVTIVGMGSDKEGAYFSYYDNYTNGKGEKVGTDINKNKFRLRQDSKGNYYFADTDNNIPLNGNQTKPLNNKEDRPARYILTEVRDNE